MAEGVLLHYDFIYDDHGADKLYQAIWGESLHFGIYTTPDEPMADAMLRTKQRMAELMKTRCELTQIGLRRPQLFIRAPALPSVLFESGFG